MLEDILEQVDRMDYQIIDTIDDDGYDTKLSNNSSKEYIKPEIKIEIKSEIKSNRKVDIAKNLYDKGILHGLGRKEIVELFIVDAGLTKAGAATYYNNFKKKSQ